MYTDWEKISPDPIGEGGQAQVFKVKKSSKEDKEIYALKLFKNPKRSERSNSEILNMKNLESLGIKVPTIIDYGEYKEGRPFFVSTYYSNGNLEDNLAKLKGQIDLLSFSKELCIQIRKMNNAGYVHRDLKPQNILLNQQYLPVICDYGLSHSLDKESGLSMTGEPIGSAHYIHPKAFDTKSVPREHQTGFDGYSFAKIFYKILTNNQLLGFSKATNIAPFKVAIPDDYIANKILRLINRLLDENIENLSNYWKSFPDEFLVALTPPAEIKELDQNTVKNIRSLYLNKLQSKNETSNLVKIEIDEIIEDIINAIKSNKAINLINDIFLENDSNEKVIINEQVNLRESLEGVGIKSDYGIDPLFNFGRRQSLVKREILIQPPLKNEQIGISIFETNSVVNILLCTLKKHNNSIDIKSESIIKLIINNENRIDKSYLIEINKYITNSIGE